MFAALRAHLRPDVPFIEIDANINDAVFAQQAVEIMLQLIESARSPAALKQGVQP
jgi:hypothetical protein